MAWRAMFTVHEVESGEWPSGAARARKEGHRRTSIRMRNGQSLVNGLQVASQCVAGSGSEAAAAGERHGSGS